VILFVTFGAHAVVQLSRGHGTEDFGYFYHAARAMWNREDIYAATNGHYIYPPFLVFIFQPLAFVSAQTAAIIWIVISGLLMFAAALIASKEAATRWHPTDAAIDPSIPWAIAAIATILVADKIDTIFILGKRIVLRFLALPAPYARWSANRCSPARQSAQQLALKI